MADQRNAAQRIVDPLQRDVGPAEAHRAQLVVDLAADGGAEHQETEGGDDRDHGAGDVSGTGIDLLEVAHVTAQVGQVGLDAGGHFTPDLVERVAGLGQLGEAKAMLRLMLGQFGGRLRQLASPLVLELFSDPDPIVRELSLRALQAVHGPAAKELLAKLLDDPDANVRAAVLKQLAGKKPPASLVSKVIDFIKKEKDADLIVHGVRVLRRSSSEAATEYLTELLNHPVWQIRAEAAEALGEKLQSGYSMNNKIKARAYSGLLQRLDDEDGFVVDYSGFLERVA